jgi:hypothetical protein
MKGQLHMKRGIRAALVAAAGVATLAFAGSALAANTASIAVWHTPMVLNGSSSTTIHISVPKATDPIARIAIYAPSTYAATFNQAVGTNIGSVEATAFSYDTQLTLPLSGTVNVDDPNSATNIANACSPGTHAAVWILNLSVSGQAIQLPLYVDATTGAETALGAYRMIICLPPPDVPQGTPGRSAFGAQVLDAKFTVNGIFKTPATAGAARWESLFTPYNPGQGSVNAVGTFEARALVPLPVNLALGVSYTKKTKAYTLKGKLTEGGTPDPSFAVSVLRGSTATALAKVASVTTKTDGSWSSSGKLKAKKVTYFKATATASERDFTAQGCVSPLPATVAPAGCASATLPPWTATSAVVRLKP